MQVYEDASDADKLTVKAAERGVYDAVFTGGVRVGVLDVDDDGDVEVLAVPGAGPERRLRILDGTTLTQLDEVFAEDAEFTSGLFVAGAF